MNILAMLYSTVFLCLAMPELPPETIANLQLVNTQAEQMALNQGGVNLPNIDQGGLFLLFSGLYRGLQAWNEWNGGDDYIVQRAYHIERTDLPEWLAEVSGDYFFWEIEYFGTTIEMITDKDGKIVLQEENGTQKKAVNVTIKNNARQAVENYKAQINPDLKNIDIPSGPEKAQLEAGNYTPYIVGNSLYFYGETNGQITQYRYSDFRNCMIVYFRGNFNYVCLGIINPAFDSGTNFPVLYNVTTGQEVGMPYGNSNCRFTIGGKEYTGYLKSVPYFNLASNIYLPGMYLQNWYGNSTNFGIVDTVNCIGLRNQQFEIKTTKPIFLGRKNGRAIALATEIPQDTFSQGSLEDILDAISQIEPVTDPETGAESLPLPEVLPLPEIVPLEPEPDPVPDLPTYPEFDFPIGDPEQVPESDPETAPTTEPTEINLPENAEEIPVPETLSVVNGLQNRFPFSIPWDIYNALSNLSAERQIPHWEWTLNVNMPFSDEVFSYTFVLDLGFMAGTVGLFRNLFLLAFILGLAVYSYNKFFGGGA